jgi:hypothetical protein
VSYLIWVVQVKSKFLSRKFKSRDLSCKFKLRSRPFLEIQDKSHVIWSEWKSSHRTFLANSRHLVTSHLAWVQVKSQKLQLESKSHDRLNRAYSKEISILHTLEQVSSMTSPCDVFFELLCFYIECHNDNIQGVPKKVNPFKFKSAITYCSNSLMRHKWQPRSQALPSCGGKKLSSRHENIEYWNYY